jgi:tripartite-type tricarboxylate transporter receptor subunit TctC
MRLTAIVLAFIAAVTFQPADAQTWPTKPVRIIVSLAAGGTPDIICRLLADRLSVALGQQVVIENRPGGALRPLATSSAERLSNYPQVPAIAETFAGVEFIGWFILAAPAGTPDEIVMRLNREMDAILKNPQISGKLADLGFFATGADTPASLRAYVRTQYELWGRHPRHRPAAGVTGTTRWRR